MSSAQQACAMCFCCGLVLTIVLVAISFQSLAATEWGLDYSVWTLSVSEQPYSAGMYYLGLGHSFIRFPNTYQNIQFSAEDNDLLYTRSSDGLPLTLGVSFQYKLIQKDLHQLYMNYKLNYDHILKNVATNIIANVACNYTAYNFFNDKQSIAVAMYRELNAYVLPHLWIIIESVQLVLVQLPGNFEDSILESISVKQNITTTEKNKANMEVTFATQIMAANQTAVQTVTLAEGTAQKIIAIAEANAIVIEQNVGAEVQAYLAMREGVGFSSSELVEYIWYDSLSQMQTDSEFIIGLNPTTYIAGI